MPMVLWTLAVLFMLVGLAGTVLPGLPGTILVFIGLCLAASVDHFSRVGVSMLLVLGILSALAYLLEVIAAGLGAKHVRASRQAIIGAVIGTIIGLFMGFLGLMVMPFLGAAAGEYLARRDLEQARRAAIGTWLGIAFGIVARLALTFLMIGIFFFAFFWHTTP